VVLVLAVTPYVDAFSTRAPPPKSTSHCIARCSTNRVESSDGNDDPDQRQ
jgi:hypothetical protein